VSQHPLIERAADREVRQAKGFRVAAEKLTGDVLAREYAQEKEGAPRRSEAGKRHLATPSRRLVAERNPARDGDHASLALVERQQRTSKPLSLPDETGDVEVLASGVVLRTAPPDRAQGASDPNWGIDAVDFLGLGPEDRLVVGVMRYVAPSATRIGAGDTPLRALLEGLAQAAVVDANRTALAAELAARTSRTPSELPPMLLLAGSVRWWELCRKREPQKGAAWIREMERLAKEVGEQANVPVVFAALRATGDPGWSYETGSPVFESEVRLVPAWEYGAGRIRPKAKPRAKKVAGQAAPVVVEADRSRAVRSYAASEHYTTGDRIQHPTLGVGVVQGSAGPGKIRVLFDERAAVLVHDRGGAR
jgi:hypothetical protein